MSTPSERIWAAFEQDPDGPGSPRLPERPTRPQTLAAAAARVTAGVPLRAAAADFLDDLRWARDEADVGDRVAAPPGPVDAHVDAYLGALAEHVAARHGIAVPDWAGQPDRFLDHFWWPSRFPAFRAQAVRESPAAFPRRGIFIGATTLVRV